MRWAFDYMQRDGEGQPNERNWLRDEIGGSVYLRLSSKTLEQPSRTMTPELERDIIDGAYWMRPPGPNCQLVIAYTGAVAPEAIEAVGLMAEDRRDVGLLAITSADRLHAGWGAAQRARERGLIHARSHIEEQPLWRWDSMFSAGVRAHYQASQLAAPAMVARRRGLIVNISFWAAQKHVGNVAYGVSKAATDKMTADMAIELRPHGVTVVSLYPGLVRTEKVMEAAAWLDLTNSESPEFIGRAVAALGGRSRCDASHRNGAGGRRLAQEYGFTDIDGKTPRPLTLADV